MEMKFDDVKELLKVSIMDNYNKSEELSSDLVDSIVLEYLKEALIDSKNMTFVEFTKKYNCKANVFEYSDFTASEIRNIISETPLTERDRKIACLRYIDLKSEEDIAYELMIDKKTVHSNIPKISSQLKRTCLKLYNK